MTGRALSRSSVNICSSLLCVATAPVAPAAQGWGWRLCSALSITITGCWRLAPASVADCRFAPGYRFLWLASVGRQRGIRKGGITLPFFSTPDDAVQSRHPACSLQLRSGANQRFACRGIRILLEVLNEQFRQRGGFPAIVPATRRCYAGRECGYPRTAVQSGSPDRTAADGRFPRYQENRSEWRR